MDGETRVKLEKQIADYKAEQEEFKRQAEQRLAFLNGAIAALQALLDAIEKTDNK